MLIIFSFSLLFYPNITNLKQGNICTYIIVPTNNIESICYIVFNFNKLHYIKRKKSFCVDISDGMTKSGVEDKDFEGMEVDSEGPGPQRCE